jgi:hypothetical protein
MLMLSKLSQNNSRAVRVNTLGVNKAKLRRICTPPLCLSRSARVRVPHITVTGTNANIEDNHEPKQEPAVDRRFLSFSMQDKTLMGANGSLTSDLGPRYHPHFRYSAIPWYINAPLCPTIIADAHISPPFFCHSRSIHQ